MVSALVRRARTHRWEHGPLPSSDEVRSGTARTSRFQVEVCADLHLRPYYGDEDDTDGLYHSVAKRGTTAFHAYATLYALVKNKRYRAVRRLKDGDTQAVSMSSSVSSTALTPGSRPNFDRGFYDDSVIRWVRRFSKSGRMESRHSA